MNQPNMITEVNDVFNTPLTTQENHMEAIITGTSGKQYVAMDTTPPRVDVGTPSVFDDRKDEPSIKELFGILLDVVQRIGAKVEALESHYHQQQKPQPTPQPLPDLATTVETILQQADWLYAKVYAEVDRRYDVQDIIKSSVEDSVKDFVESEVDNYFTHNFNIDDHADVDDIIKEAVRDSIEDVVREALTNVTMSFNI